MEEISSGLVNIEVWVSPATVSRDGEKVMRSSSASSCSGLRSESPHVPESDEQSSLAGVGMLMRPVGMDPTSVFQQLGKLRDLVMRSYCARRLTCKTRSWREVRLLI